MADNDGDDRRPDLAGLMTLEAQIRAHPFSLRHLAQLSRLEPETVLVETKEPTAPA
jgi:hypothetical protein